MKTIRLRENLGLRFTADGCEIHGPRGIKIMGDTHQDILRRLFEEGLPLAEAFDSESRALLKTLSDKKLLRLHEDDYTRDEIWLSHFVADARQSLSELAKKRVLIVGCGGTGAVIADHLARAGVRHFVLVDGAELDAPDLNRQWTYRRADVGRRKVDLLAAHLRDQLGAEAKPVDRYLTNAADIKDLATQDFDLIVCAADKPRLVVENLILDLAEQKQTPVLFGAVGITDDHVGAVLDSVERRRAERARLKAERELGIEVKIARGSLGFTNTVAAAKIGLTAYRFLLGISGEGPA